MNIFNITDEIQIITKSRLSELAYDYFDSQEVIFTSLSCIDLMNAYDLKSKYNLLNARFLLIYQFQNLALHKREFYGVALSYGQTITSFAHLYSAMTWFEAEINRHYGVHFYHKDDRIQHEIVHPSSKYSFEKDTDSKDICLSYFKDCSIGHEEVVVPIKKFLGPYSKSNILFDVNANLIENIKFEFDLGSSKSFEKYQEGKSIDHIVGSFLESDFSLKYMSALLCVELKEYTEGKLKSPQANIQRMFIFEVLSALENLKCLENIFKKAGMSEVTQFISLQYRSIVKKLNLANISNYDEFISLLEKEDRSWIYQVRDLIHEFQDEINHIIEIAKGNDYFLSLDDSFNGPLPALNYSLKSYPLQSLGHHYNIKKFESFYEYCDLNNKEFLSLRGTTYEIILIRLQELSNNYSNIIKVCEEYPVIKKRFKQNGEESLKGIFYATTQVSSGELSVLCYLNDDSKVERFHYITPSLTNIEYFKDRLKRFSLAQIACEWNALGINEEEVIK